MRLGDAAHHGEAQTRPGLHIDVISVSERLECSRGKALWHPRSRIDDADGDLAANGEVWAGRGAETGRVFPAIDNLPAAEIPDENACSVAIRLRYGAFGYFAAGDLTSDSFDGTLPWHDVETPASEVSGPVNVAVAFHPGMFDATGADVVRALGEALRASDAQHDDARHGDHAGRDVLVQQKGGQRQAEERLQQL